MWMNHLTLMSVVRHKRRDKSTSLHIVPAHLLLLPKGIHQDVLLSSSVQTMLVELMFLFEFCEVNRVSCVTAATEPLCCPLGLVLDPLP